MSRLNIVALVILVAGFALSSARADAGTIVSVDGRSNIFASGLTTVPSLGGGGGLLPVEYAFGGGGGTGFTFSVSGFTNCCSGTPNTPGDGAGGATNIASLGGFTDFRPDHVVSHRGLSRPKCGLGGPVGP